MARSVVPCLLTVVALTVVAAQQPILVLVAVLGIPVLGWGFLRPKGFIAVALIVCMFGKSAALLTGITAVDLADELLIAASLLVCLGPRLLRGQEVRTFPGLGWFLVFVALGLLSALAVDAPLVVLGSGASLAAKGILLAVAVAQLQWTTSDLRHLARGGAVLLFFILACALVNLAIPQTWQLALGNIDTVSYRSAIPSLIGPFVEPGTLGIIAALGFLAVVAWNAAMGSTRMTWVLAAGMALVAVCSFRRKTWLGMIGSYIWLSSRAGRPAVFVTAVLTVAGIVVVFASTVINAVVSLVATYGYQAEGTAARTVMTRDSFFVALEHFPLGAGFGRFGSETAAVYYSPEYLARGYQYIWGLSAATGNDHFLTDTMWPAILGETGLFGCLAFVLALATIFRRLRHLSRSQVSIIRWVGLTGIAWIVQYLLESTGNPVFVSPPSYVPFFLLAGLLGSLDGTPPRSVAAPVTRVEGWPGRVVGRIGQLTGSPPREAVVLAGLRT
jgi:hypothetical protein